MPKEERPLSIISVRLFTYDLEQLKEFYPRGYNKVIRKLVARHIRRLKERSDRAIERNRDALGRGEVDDS